MRSSIGPIGSLDASEVELARRYVESRGYEATITSSNMLFINSTATQETLDKLLRSYSGEFAVSFRKRYGVIRIYSTSPKHAYPIDRPITAKALANRWAKTSRVKVALRLLIERNQTAGDLKVTGFSYRIRPLIQDNGQRTESAEVWVTMMKKDGTRETQFISSLW